MIQLKTVQDFFKKDIQNIFSNLNNNLGINFVGVFDLKNQELIAFYVCQSILVPDEQNRKTFLIKGKLINNFDEILQQNKIENGYWNNDLKTIIDTLPLSIHTFSENLFGFIGFGLRGY